jgi:hypothetical protein
MPASGKTSNSRPLGFALQRPSMAVMCFQSWPCWILDVGAKSWQRQTNDDPSLRPDSSTVTWHERLRTGGFPQASTG